MAQFIFENDPISHLLGAWSTSINVYSIALKLVIAILFSAVIGWERAEKRHSAGLRTFILVTMTSTIAMIIDVSIIEASKGTMFVPVLSAAIVVASAMVSGNSILFSSKNQIKGLTTSAALWAFSLLGLIIGIGSYTTAIIAFVLFMIVIAFATKLEKSFKDKSNHFEINLELKNKDKLQDFVATIRKLGLKIDDIESNPAFIGSGLSVYTVTLTIISDELKKYKSHTEIIQALSSLEYVNHIEEI